MRHLNQSSNSLKMATNKRTLDAFFKPPAKKAKVSDTIDEADNTDSSSVTQVRLSLYYFY